MSAAAGTPSISAGVDHSIALKADGTVQGWGSDALGGLGSGRILDSPNPLQVAAISTITALSSGLNYTVALKRDGTVWAWGDNRSGQLGDGTTTNLSVPTKVINIADVIEVSAGGIHTMALKRDGTVWAWGQGPVGDGTSETRLTAVQVSILSGVTTISAGQFHSAAVKADGSVWTWGTNTYGQLGDSTTITRLAPILVGALSGVASVAGGGYHTLARKSDGTVWAWGRNESGQLGDGTIVNRSTPVRVVGLTDITAISAGAFNSVALRSDGSVWQWGSGQSTPVMVNGLAGVASISAGDSHVASLKSDGSIWTWGNNFFGQLGDGTNIGRSDPVRVNGVIDAVAISAGSYHSAAATRNTGFVFAWGDNNSGQLGDGALTSRATPGDVGGVSGVKAISAGHDHTVMLKEDGSALATGYNVFGQLGDGSSTSRSSPVAVSGLSGVSAVSAGGFYSLALTTDGRVWSWGYNVSGQLGNGTTRAQALPAALTAITGLTAISAGSDHALALKFDGTVWGWGLNLGGALGNVAQVPILSPVKVSGLSEIVAIAAGQGFTVALRSDGTVWALGNNQYGQLGDGTLTSRSTPAQVNKLVSIVAISASRGHAAALRSDGTVWTWGFNLYGSLGDGTTVSRTTPVQVIGLTGINAISVGGRGANSFGGTTGHSLALKTDGTVLAWGNNGFGQLGDGSLSSQTKPIVVVRKDGAGGIQTNDWFLDLNPTIAKSIPTDKIPAFLSVARGSESYVKATLQYRAQDVGINPNLYIFALAPSRLVQPAAGSPATSMPMRLGSTEKGVATAGPETCVLAQLNPSGQLVAASASSLQAYLTGVLTSQGASVSVLNGVSTALLQGSTFFVGYGSSPTAMLNGGTNRSVLTVGELQACTTPDGFSFIPQTGVALNVTATSNAVTIGGTNFIAAPINVTNGSYRINSGTFVPSVGLITRGDTVTVQVLSSAMPNTQTCATVDISGVSGPFCVTTMQASVTNYALTVTKAGTGSGTVTSNPAGIACNADCSNDFASGTAITLSAVPASGSTFAGWSGACSGTGTCTVTMTGAKSVMATYALVPNSTPPAPFSFDAQGGIGLNQTVSSNAVTITGLNSAVSVSIANGSYRINAGAFTSNPGSISSGDSVTVQLLASAQYNTQTCATLNIGGVNGVFCVTTTFEPGVTTYPLNVSKAGTGAGTVTSSPAGISCGGSCSAEFTSGTSVILTPTAVAGSKFTGWGGACTGTGSCTVNMNAAASVTATFALEATLPLVPLIMLLL